MLEGGWHEVPNERRSVTGFAYNCDPRRVARVAIAHWQTLRRVIIQAILIHVQGEHRTLQEIHNLHKTPTGKQNQQVKGRESSMSVIHFINLANGHLQWGFGISPFERVLARY